MAQATPATILLIDDEASLVNVLAELLRRRDYTVTTVDTIALAWEHLQTQPYDVILCDLVMPDGGGQALYSLLQQYYPTLCARVIFLTGDAIGETSTAFLHQCGQPWLYKPFGAADVLGAITQMIAATDSPLSEGDE